MVQMKKVGGRYGMRSGSARFKNLEVDQNLWVEGNTWPLGMVRGTIWYVDTNVAASGDGQSWGTAFKTITEGIAALNNGDALIIGAGNYNEAGKLTLEGLRDVHIFGVGTGMQWNEGSTVLGDENSSADILDINDCRGIEIAGLGFYNSVADKDVINFGATMSYSVHIHDCCFIGDVGGGAVTVYAINAGANVTDLYVHDCKFFRVKTAAINDPGQRAVIRNNVFIVPTNGIGIAEPSTASGYVIITDNDLLGGGSGDTGISFSTMGAGNCFIARNRFCNFATEVSTGKANADSVFVDNYMDDTAGGYTVVDPAV